MANSSAFYEPTDKPTAAAQADDSALPQKERQAAMRVLALSAPHALERAYAQFEPRPEWTFVRRPETGLAMVRGATGGGGAIFNLGEMTVTRAAVQLTNGEVGYAYLHGRNQRQAAIAAFFDAAHQNQDLRTRIKSEVLAPLAKAFEEEDARTRRRAEATKVEFFTMERGDV